MATSPSTVPVVLCVDVEPDARQVTRDGGGWTGVPETARVLEGWRRRFEDATAHPARLSWFWRADPQVTQSRGSATWGFDTFRDLLDDTTARGDAHGVHPHLWRRVAGRDTWIADGHDPSWIRTCIDVSLEAFAEAVGHRCELVRMGDRFLDQVAYDHLARRGVRIDMTVEPGEPAFGIESVVAGAGFEEAPGRPYRPRRRDIARPSRLRRGPVLLPLSAAVAVDPRDGRTRRRTVYPWHDDAAALFARLLDDGAPYLAFAVRSDLAHQPALLAGFEATLAALAQHRRAGDLRFVVPEQAVATLRRAPLGISDPRGSISTR